MAGRSSACPAARPTFRRNSAGGSGGVPDTDTAAITVRGPGAIGQAELDPPGGLAVQQARRDGRGAIAVVGVERPQRGHHLGHARHRRPLAEPIGQDRPQLRHRPHRLARGPDAADASGWASAPTAAPRRPRPAPRTRGCPRSGRARPGDRSSRAPGASPAARPPASRSPRSRTARRGAGRPAPRARPRACGRGTASIGACAGAAHSSASSAATHQNVCLLRTSSA